MVIGPEISYVHLMRLNMEDREMPSAAITRDVNVTTIFHSSMYRDQPLSCSCLFS